VERQAPLNNQLKEESMSTSNQFIFGYGSLVESQSRARTSPSALYAFPATVAGIQRGWFDQVGAVSLSTTYLGAVPDPSANCNGVIFQVSQPQLNAFDQRETGYNRERIDQKNMGIIYLTNPTLHATMNHLKGGTERTRCRRK
jgi:hypothetical protein